MKKIDAAGGFLTPGLLDLHVHGGAGKDFFALDRRDLLRILRFHYRRGTTSLLPTFSAALVGEIAAATEFIKKASSEPPGSSTIVGINSEGPFLNPARAGAQKIERILPPDPKLLKKIISAAGGRLKLMTLAPEVEGAPALIPLLKDAGVIPAIGHTLADYRTARRAILAGIAYATHIFNAYPPFHHREPGALGAIFDSPEVYTEVIADGIHVSPPVLRFLFRLRPLERIILVSDCVASETGAGQRKRRLPAARLPDGTLAGGRQGLGEAVWNLVRWVGLPLERALIPATLNPARVLNLEKKKGDLDSGMDADLVIWSAGGQALRTVVGGETVYQKR